MIQANELRIGNYVTTGITQTQVEGITKHDPERFYVDLLYVKSLIPIAEIEPIPITEEWLLRFGFEKDSRLTYKNKNKFYIWECNDPNDSIYKQGFYWEEIHLPYVHKLQNLYFALTGKELECLV